VAGIVRFEKADGVATLTLDNPKARNAFDYEMTQQLRRYWGEIARDPEFIVLVAAGDDSWRDRWRFLEDNPALGTIRAIREGRFLALFFSLFFSIFY
jgi:hypothetical protein